MAVLTLISSTVIVGALTCCALIHSEFDLKATEMNVQFGLILEFTLNELKLGHNTVEASKSICCTKDESPIDHSIVTR